MLSLKTCPSLSLTFSPSKHSKNTSFAFKPYHQCPPRKSQSTIMMAASSQAVEHVVLFKTKNDVEPSKVNTMVNEQRTLVSLEQVRHLTVGPILRNTTATTVPSSDLRFTHMLHSRYDSPEDLEAYIAHPNHLAAVKGYVFPICEDLLVIDWVAGDAALPPHPQPGSAIRVSFLKLKDDKDVKVKEEVLRVVGGIKENIVGNISNVSFGENITPARAKGFSIASLVVFPGQREMESVDPSEVFVKVKEHLESVVVVDYVVPFE